MLLGKTAVFFREWLNKYQKVGRDKVAMETKSITIRGQTRSCPNKSYANELGRDKGKQDGVMTSPAGKRRKIEENGGKGRKQRGEYKKK